MNRACRCRTCSPGCAATTRSSSAATCNAVRSTFIDLSDISGTFSFDNAADFPGQCAQPVSPELPSGINPEEHLHRLLCSGRMAHALQPGVESTACVTRRRRSFAIETIGDRAFRSLTIRSRHGKTVIRFGAGIFYNRALLRTIDDFTLGAQQLFFDTNDLIDPATGQSRQRRFSTRLHCSKLAVSASANRRLPAG